MKFTKKTQAEIEALSAVDLDKYIAEKEANDAEIRKAEIDEAIKTATTSLNETIEKQGKKIIELDKNSTGNKVISLVDELKSHEEGLKKSAKKGNDYTFVVKAHTLRASVVGNPNAMILPEIGQLAHRKLTIYDMFRKIPVPANSNGTMHYTDWDADTIVRATAAIAEGGTFPEDTAKWVTNTVAVQKIGSIIPVSEEMLYDAPAFAAELENFLNTNVAIKIDTDLVTGNGTSPNIAGIKTQIPNYTPVASGIEDASIYDLLVKVREAISAPYGSKYSPNVALMNISDINKMKLKKDANFNYIMPPFFDQNGAVVDGMTVLECNAFAANTMAVGDSRYGAIYEVPGVVVETGMATGDFESDMVSLKARRRLNLLIRNVEKSAWLEVTSISAALTTLAQ